jgi:acetyltransferase-like isoleucine patch superfamily enzyme
MNKLDIHENVKSKVKINVSGINNIITVSDIKKVGSIKIECDGDANVFIGKLRRVGSLNIKIKGGGDFYIDELSTVEDAYVLIEKGCKVIIGKDCMLSFQISIRTSDAHGIYDAKTGDLINRPGNITLGDHVWIAQGVVISKDSIVGNNSVIGFGSYVRNVSLPASSICAGTPVKVIRDNIVWDRRMDDNIFAVKSNKDPYLHMFYDSIHGD